MRAIKVAGLTIEVVKIVVIIVVFLLCLAVQRSSTVRQAGGRSSVYSPSRLASNRVAEEAVDNRLLARLDDVTQDGKGPSIPSDEYAMVDVLFQTSKERESAPQPEGAPRNANLANTIQPAPPLTKKPTPRTIQPAPSVSTGMFSTTLGHASSDASWNFAELFSRPRSNMQRPRIQSAPPLSTVPVISKAAFNSGLVYRMHAIHNDERSQQELPLLEMNETLCQVAVNYAKVLSKKGEMSHTADGVLQDRLARAGYRWTKCGENLFNSVLADCEGVFHAWMNSPDHRKNITNAKFRECGIGRQGYIWVVVFALPERERS